MMRLRGLRTHQGRIGPRPRRLSRDARGNIQVVETLVVGVLVVAAIFAVTTLNAPTTQTEGFKRDNERLVKDSLTALLNRPSEYEAGTTFGSALEEYVMHAVAGNKKPLMNYLNKTLPGGALYDVFLDTGYGPPVQVIDQGRPPREAVAGSIQFVPKLQFTFLLPEFRHYHGDFHQNVYAVPVQHGVLLHDEGDTVELGVTFREVDGQGNLGTPFTLKTYGHTALKMNDPANRHWPSVSIWYNETGTRSYLHDARNLPLYGDKVETLLQIPGGGPVSWAGDAYNITFELVLEETAGYEIPEGATITVEFPRGWAWNATKRNYMANNTGLGNPDHWEDMTWEGETLEGTRISAKLKEGAGGQRIPFWVSANYVVVFDTAYPYFNVITAFLGDGAQGMANVVVQPPSAEVFGVFRRDGHLSIPKPIISGGTSYWGVVFTNNGGTVQVDEVTLTQPQGRGIMADVAVDEQWTAGTWVKTGTGAFRWTPTSPATARLIEGEAAWLGLQVTAGTTTDNHYRNQDYQDVRYWYNPHNTTDVTTYNEFNFTKVAHKMGEEWVYREGVPPADGDDVTGIAPGWPDEALVDYWVRGGTYVVRAELLGNSTYAVLPSAFTSNTFGDYQGSHVFSQLHVTDASALPERTFAAGDRVYLRNDFNALFGRLSQLDAQGTVSVTDLKIRTNIYTPERAWNNVPSVRYEESADVIADIGTISFMESGDLDQDGVLDIVLVGSTGLVYAMDGRDGAKFWTHEVGAPVTAAALVDYDGNGQPELLVGIDGPTVIALDTTLGVAGGASRVLWTHDATHTVPVGIGAYSVNTLTDASKASGSPADLIVGVSAASAQAYVQALTVTRSGATWQIAKSGTYDLDTDLTVSVNVLAATMAEVDGESRYVFTSLNGTATSLDAADAGLMWVSPLTSPGSEILAADLDGDGSDEIVVDTYSADFQATSGRYLLVLDGATGHYGPRIRSMLDGAFEHEPREGLAAPDGSIFVVGGANFLIADNESLYGSFLAGAELVQGGATLHEWMGLDLVGNDVYIIDKEGEVRRTHHFDHGFGIWVWEQVTLANPADLREYQDLHYDPGATAPGPSAYRFTDTGLITRSQDASASWADIASICQGGPGVNANVVCASGMTVTGWETVTAAGVATKIVAIVTTDTGGSPIGRILEYDVATASWASLATWNDIEIHGYDRAPDGRFWIAGKTSGGLPVIDATGAGQGTYDTIVGMAFDVTLDSILMKADGTGFVADRTGRTWARTVQGDWTGVATQAIELSSDRSVLVEDPDGTVWVFTDDYSHAPLVTYAPEAWLYLPPAFVGASPSFTGNDLVVEATVGRLGGDASVELWRSLTKMDWEYRLSGGAWTPIPPKDADGPEDEGLLNVTWETPLNCPAFSTICQGLELRVRLHQRMLTDADDPMRHDPSASPLLRAYTVRITDGGSALPEHRAVTPAVMATPGTTAVYSEFGRGAMLPATEARWAYRGATDYDTPILGTRFAAASTTGLDTGTGPADLALVETAALTTRFGVLDGGTGSMIVTGDTGQFAPGDSVSHVQVADLTDDGREDVLLAVAFQGPDVAMKVWDLAAGAYDESPRQSADAVTGLVFTGKIGGKPTWAIADSDAEVVAFHGPVGVEPIDDRWTRSPAQAQGLATFTYDIPGSALFGTAIVVSELSFDITEAGVTATQTARLVDWFDITPPDRVMPRPPIYSVEIVSWFNEV